MPLLTRLKGVGEEEDASGLSASERRVAALAAAGHSNREIAEQLFVTVSTVEQHLTHTYRKLRVKGRAELARSLGPAAERHAHGRCAAGRQTGGQSTPPRPSRLRRVSSA